MRSLRVDLLMYEYMYVVEGVARQQVSLTLEAVNQELTEGIVHMQDGRVRIRIHCSLAPLQREPY